MKLRHMNKRSAGLLDIFRFPSLNYWNGYDESRKIVEPSNNTPYTYMHSYQSRPFRSVRYVAVYFVCVQRIFYPWWRWLIGLCMFVRTRMLHEGIKWVYKQNTHVMDWRFSWRKKNQSNPQQNECDANELFAKRVFCMRIKYFIINWNEGVESVAVVDVFRTVCFSFLRYFIFLLGRWTSFHLHFTWR